MAKEKAAAVSKITKKESMSKIHLRLLHQIYNPTTILLRHNYVIITYSYKPAALHLRQYYAQLRQCYNTLHHCYAAATPLPALLRHYYAAAMTLTHH